jgi:hypothetical protein
MSAHLSKSQIAELCGDAYATFNWHRKALIRAFRNGTSDKPVAWIKLNSSFQSYVSTHRRNGDDLVAASAWPGYVSRVVLRIKASASRKTGNRGRPKVQNECHDDEPKLCFICASPRVGGVCQHCIAELESPSCSARAFPPQHEQRALHQQLRGPQSAEEGLAAAVLGCRAVQALLDRLSVPAQHCFHDLYPVVPDGDVLLGQSAKEGGRQRRGVVVEVGEAGLGLVAAQRDASQQPLQRRQRLHYLSRQGDDVQVVDEAVQHDVGLCCQLWKQFAHVHAEHQAGQRVALPPAVAGLDGLSFAALQNKEGRRCTG